MGFKSYVKDEFGISEQAIDLLLMCEKKVRSVYKRYEEIAEMNQLRVIEAFRRNKISPRHFAPSTGYGYDDEGREKLCAVFADVFGAQDAIVSPMLMSGTHAITTALFGLLRPGDKVLCATGTPYDTLNATVCGGPSSLQQFGIGYQQIARGKNESIDTDAILRRLSEDDSFKMVYLQRSTGYDIRKAYTTQELKKVIEVVKNKFPDINIFVDNCYGEFVCEVEPTHVGADIVVGSLIKNPGGGLAPTGGYIAGRRDLIEKISFGFTSPGVGNEIGSYAGGYRMFYQGLFMAPHAVLQALKCVVLASAVFAELGYETQPSYKDVRGDITQFIVFKQEEPLVNFVRGIQKASAVDGYVVPYAWEMPGYQDKVIMAAGTFVQGASIELTADAPIRPPYAAYLQGALTYEHAKLGILFALHEMNLS